MQFITQAPGHNTIYRNAAAKLDNSWAKHDLYTVNELDDIYFKNTDTEIHRRKAQGLFQVKTCERTASPVCGIGMNGGRFDNKGDFLKSLNELLSWAPKEGMRKKYANLIKKGTQQNYVDLSLLKKMDSHLEWALKRNDNRTEMKKEELDENFGRFIAQ